MSSRIEAAKALIALLAERWPNCFTIYERRRRPLKLGIRIDILAALGDAVDYGLLKAALGRYCSSVGYLRNCIEGAARVDLGGDAVGSVSAAEAKHASARLGRRTIPKRINGTAADSAVATAITGPKRLSLDDLKAAARRRLRHL